MGAESVNVWLFVKIKVSQMGYGMHPNKFQTQDRWIMSEYLLPVTLQPTITDLCHTNPCWRNTMGFLSSPGRLPSFPRVLCRCWARQLPHALHQRWTAKPSKLIISQNWQLFLVPKPKSLLANTTSVSQPHPWLDHFDQFHGCST